MFDFFKSKKKKENEIDAAFEKVTRELQSIDDWEDPKKLEHYILDSCEQIIATTKEIESERKEYKNVTAYLNDVTKIENLPEDKRNRLTEVANNVVELTKAQYTYEHAAPRITDSQYLVMKENAQDIPDTISRMTENEAYQESVQKNMRFLEGEKSRYEMERDDEKHRMGLMRILGILLLVVFASVLVLIYLLRELTGADTSWGTLLVILISAAIGVMIFLQYSASRQNAKKALKQLNKTISMLNSVKIRYVNITNAIEYVKEKYGVNTAAELNYVWEQYLLASKEREQYRNNNTELEYFSDRLSQRLNELELYDADLWLNQTNALINRNEMVEVKHDLIQQRKAIRKRIQENTAAVKSERDEIDNLMREHNYYVPEILEIIQSVDKLCGLNKKRPVKR